MAAGVILFVALLSLAIPLVLYVLINRETANPTVTDRASAERAARRHGGLEDEGGREEPTAASGDDRQ